MGRLDGKIALISGSARGQGAVEAKLFAREGAKVVLGDLLDEAGKQVEETIRQHGGEATYVHLDVTSEADWVEAVGTAVNRYGTLDILVNNAGMSGASASGEPVHLEDATEAAWDRVLAVNAKGVFLGTKHAIPAMRQAGGGVDYQYLLHRGVGGWFWAEFWRLRRLQRRGAPVDQVHRDPVRQGRYTV